MPIHPVRLIYSASQNNQLTFFLWKKPPHSAADIIRSAAKISPLDHIGPEDLRIKELLDRVDREKISEIIFALPADVEGEATTNYIVDLLKSKPVTLTRIARGIPAGGGLESADELTLSAALSGEQKFDR